MDIFIKQSENVGGCATYRNMLREKEQFELLQKKWGSSIVKYDGSKMKRAKKQKMFDYKKAGRAAAPCHRRQDD